MPLNVMKVVFHNVRSSVSLLVSAIVRLDLLLLGGICNSLLAFATIFLLLKISFLLAGFLLVKLLLFDLLLHIVLFGGWDLTHGAHILGFFVDLLHVVARCEHLVLAHSAGSTSSSLFALPFAFLSSTLVKGSVELGSKRVCQES